MKNQSDKLQGRGAAPGRWHSPITAHSLFSHNQVVSQPRPWKDGFLFLLTMPDEGNAHALMYCGNDAEALRLSPPGMNLRSRVHEYGGAAYTAGDREVFYVNFKDQAIYRQSVDVVSGRTGTPVRLTEVAGNPDRCLLRYADLIFDRKRDRLLCLREDHRFASGEDAGDEADADRVVNALVAIGLDSASGPVAAGQQTVLFDDTDFVMSPCLSPDGDLLSFVTWLHPNMPWDTTQLRLALLNQSGQLAQCLQVDAGETSSKLQPSFGAESALYFLSDSSGYWNLVKVDAPVIQEVLNTEGPLLSRSLHPVDADNCPPPWQTGNSSYAVLDSGNVIISQCRNCEWSLHHIAVDTGEETRLEENLGLLDHVRACTEPPPKPEASSTDEWPAFLFLGADPMNQPRVWRRDSLHRSRRARPAYAPPTPDALPPDHLSQPEHFAFSTADGMQAYGLFYRPVNPRYQLAADELPPLLVNVHGGPTSTARAVLNPVHQFWTSRGFAVVDVNHRGSSGYGRQFRQQLYQQWGVVDVEDVIHAVRHLIEWNLVDADKVAIRGSSAGGYVVLACLAHSELFAAGVSYYGVSDLELLARGTHKFESRYLDQLIGPYPQTQERYRSRSPIHRIEAIRAPVLLLQGSEDRVVPPNQAQRLFDRLRSTNPETRYICFDGEGHGFRRPQNQITAANAELHFYQRNLLKVSD